MNEIVADGLFKHRSGTAILLSTFSQLLRKWRRSLNRTFKPCVLKSR